MLRLLIVTIVVAISFAELASAVPSPVGVWTFDDPNQLTQAEVGSDLILVGSQLAVAGPAPDDGAARIDVGSHYICTNGLTPNGGGSLDNEYTLVMDLQTFGRGLWHCLFQTNEANGNDGDAFISVPGRVGVSATGRRDLPLSRLDTSSGVAPHCRLPRASTRMPRTRSLPKPPGSSIQKHMAPPAAGRARRAYL